MNDVIVMGLHKLNLVRKVVLKGLLEHLVIINIFI